MTKNFGIERDAKILNEFVNNTIEYAKSYYPETKVTKKKIIKQLNKTITAQSIVEAIMYSEE